MAGPVRLPHRQRSHGSGLGVFAARRSRGRPRNNCSCHPALVPDCRLSTNVATESSGRWQAPCREKAGTHKHVTSCSSTRDSGDPREFFFTNGLVSQASAQPMQRPWNLPNNSTMSKSRLEALSGCGSAKSEWDNIERRLARQTASAALLRALQPCPWRSTGQRLPLFYSGTIRACATELNA